MKLTSVLVRLTLICFGVVLAIFVSEVLLRYIPTSLGYIDNGLIRIPWFSAEHDFDPEIGFWPKPNQAFSRRTECYHIERVSINSWGMRSLQQPNPSDLSKVRIAVLGDSFVQGLQVSDNEHFSSILQRLLPGTEVFNFGVSSMGTIQQLLTYRSRVAKLKPDIVIQAFFVGNDLFDNSAVLEGCYTGRDVVYERPYYRPDGSISRPSAQVPRRYYEDANTSAQRLHNFLTGHSFTYNAIYKLASDLKNTELAAKAEKEPACSSWPYTPTLIPLGAFTDPPDASWQEAWNDTQQAILELKREIESNGSRYLLMIIPEIPLNYERYLDALAKSDPLLQLSSRRFSIDYPAEQLYRFSTAEGITTVSLGPVINSYSERYLGDPLFLKTGVAYRCDAHWNPLGHYLAANAIAKFIIEHQLLPNLNVKHSVDVGAMSHALTRSPRSVLGAESFDEIYNDGVYTGNSGVNLYPN